MKGIDVHHPHYCIKWYTIHAFVNALQVQESRYVHGSNHWRLLTILSSIVKKYFDS